MVWSLIAASLDSVSMKPVASMVFGPIAGIGIEAAGPGVAAGVEKLSERRSKSLARATADN